MPARTPTDPLTVLPGVGPKLAGTLAGMGLTTLTDLLFHLPRGYEDRTRVWPLGDVAPGMKVQIIARVEQANIRFGRRRSLLVSLTDGTGRIGMRLFHFSKAQMRQFEPGQWLRLFGEVRPGPRGLEMAHPEYRLAASREAAGAEVEATLTPIYSVTSGITNPRLRGLIGRALDDCLGALDDPLGPLPAQFSQLPSLQAAIKTLHRPPPDADLQQLAAGQHPAQQRLAFEELLAHHLSLARLKRRLADTLRAKKMAHNAGAQAALFKALGFAPTGAQSRVIGEIATDMARTTPMMRLVQGDVGAGKTVVAAAALVQAVAAGQQGALMAPTELLAEQHAQTLRGWFEPLGVEVVLVSGRLPKAQRDAANARLASGDPLVAVGTHALFQASTQLPALGLVVVDEQHRFGVHQRLALLEKGQAAHPHQLIMTATPIPRTLAMQAYADLDTSVIDELPPGRTPVKTVAISQVRRDEVIVRIAAACAANRQAYWVNTLIEESEQLDAEAAEATAERLKKDCPHLRIGLAHGRLKPADKQAVMGAFKAGELDVLVATTVIEVGVDVPNASLMIIENAERLGLAQLHQLRGRVGRGAIESFCVLLYQPPLGKNAQARLDTLRRTNDGFEIAEKDLQLRGPGEVLGTRQTGEVGLRVANLVSDAALIEPVQDFAAGLSAADEDRLHSVLGRRWLAGAETYARA